MIAETAYNVIQSLTKEELRRLFSMLNVTPLNFIKKTQKGRKKPLDDWTLESVTEKLLSKQFNKK